jgi:protein TonB
MTPTKETLETASPVQDTTTPKAGASGGHLRADAVSLDVPIKVHGTRVSEAARGAVPQTEPFEETTSTMIVFPQGAVVKMVTAVVGGQMVVLTNLKSGHDAICRIVKVRPYAQAHSYVEIEFTHRQPGYWGVYFPSDSTADASPTVPFAGGSSHAAPAVSVEMKIEKGRDADSDEKFWELAGHSLPKPTAASGIASVPAAALPSLSTTAPLNAPTPIAISPSAIRPGRPESAFAPIGSQEDVQAAASATNSAGADTGLATETSESLAVAAEGGHALSQPAHVAPFGRFVAASNLKTGAAEGVHDVATSHSETRKNPTWLPMLLGIAALLITVVGGGLFYYFGPFTNGVSESAATAPTPSRSAPLNPAPASQVAAANTATPAVAVVAADVPVRATDAAPAKLNKAPVQEAAQPAAPVQEAAQPADPVRVKSAVKVPDMFGALNAHPVSPRRASDLAGTQSAPAIDATGASIDGGPMKGLTSAIAPPSPFGGGSASPHLASELKPPRLVSSVLPIYPALARQMGVQGDVVVQVSINKSGNVSTMNVVSGPPMLRQAALDALRRWKYDPSVLDGQPVATQMTVRISFHK